MKTRKLLQALPEGLPGPARLTMLALCDSTGIHGGPCDMKISEIMSITKLRRRTQFRALKQLRDANLVGASDIIKSAAGTWRARIVMHPLRPGASA